jgi:1-acyl-sn-glycerol-3-phosphate acyltransferase
MVGYLDIPFGIISKQELKKIPIFSSWMKLFRCTFIDRSTTRKSVLAINQAIIKTSKRVIPSLYSLKVREARVLIWVILSMVV